MPDHGQFNSGSTGDQTQAGEQADEILSPTVARASDLTMTMDGGPRGEPAPPVTLPPGAYAVGKEIARGGMGCVLHAEDRKLGRVVAMKVMRLEAAASEAAQTRFIREATVLARLEHPNIVPIHELGWDAENRLYYTMKLVQGRTLQAIINGLRHRDADFIGWYTLDRLLTIFRKICDAMSLAHSRGVIHRDLKPENVMVGEFGEVLVMDWGLAKIQTDPRQAADEAARKAQTTQPGASQRFRDLADSELQKPGGLTLDGAVMGTPLYMSPEQAAGDGPSIDRQSDIFSLGGILYALLTLHPPVDGKTTDELLSKIRRGEIRPPTAYNIAWEAGSEVAATPAATANPKLFQPLPHCPAGKVPAALSAVAMRAMSLEKSSRYKTVAELAADIEAFQGGFATRAEEAGLLQQLRLLVARHKREFGVALAAWLVITGLVVWFVIGLRASERETRRQADIARVNERRAVDSAELARANERRANASAALALQNEKRAIDQADRAAKAERAALDEKEAARRALARAQIAVADAAFAEADRPAMVQALQSCPTDLRDQTWQYLWDKRDSSARMVAAHGLDVVLSATAINGRPGRFVLGDVRGRMVVFDAMHQTALSRVERDIPGKILQLSSSADGSRLAVRSGDDLVSIVEDNKVRALKFDGRAKAICLSSDGKRLAAYLSTPTAQSIVLADADDGHILWTQPTTFINQILFHPDGRRLLVRGDQIRAFWILSADDGHQLGITHVWAYSMSLSEDGKTVAMGTLEGDMMLLDAATAAEIRREKLFAGAIRWVDWTVDGRVLMIGSQGKLGDERWVIRYWNPRTRVAGGAMFGVENAEVSRASFDRASGILIVPGQPVRCWQIPLAREVFRWDQNSAESGMPSFLSETELIGRNGDLTLFDVKTPAKPRAKRDPTITGYTFSAVHWPSGHYAVARINHEFKVFARENGRSVEKLSGAFSTMRAIHFDQSGNRLAVVTLPPIGPAALDVYSIEAGRVWHAVEAFQDAAFVAGNKVAGLIPAVVKGDDIEYQLALYDGATGKKVKSATFRFRVNGMAVSPDYQSIALGGADRMVHLIDARTLEERSAFRAHDNDVNVIAFHPRAPILATASSDGSVKLWDLKTQRLLDTFLGLDGTPTCLAFNPSDRLLYADGQEHASRLYDTSAVTEASLGPTTQPVGR